jgi:hypothetical protein
MPRQRPIYWPQSVELQLHKILKGDHISVVWIDASESSNVPIKREIHNHSIESVCTSEGTFLQLQRGKAYSDYHLLMVKDRLDEEKMRIQSIPLVLIKSISIFRRRPSSLKRQLIKLRKRKFTLHFKDGSVKSIGTL